MKTTCAIILLTVISAIANSPKSQNAKQDTAKQTSKQVDSKAILDSIRTRDDSIVLIKKQIDESYQKSKNNVTIIEKEARSLQRQEKNINQMIRLVKTNNSRVDVKVEPIPSKVPEPDLPAIQIAPDTTKRHSGGGIFKWFKRRE